MIIVVSFFFNYKLRDNNEINWIHNELRISCFFCFLFLLFSFLSKRFQAQLRPLFMIRSSGKVTQINKKNFPNNRNCLFTYTTYTYFFFHSLSRSFITCIANANITSSKEWRDIHFFVCLFRGRL